uniref:Integrase catalytic domain-containing protein n=1 Tax=Tanacetum cinerariifolium TaxID=118510 RepID=A0A6L2LYD0_TANCI|nr:hypothetical protein [Tanacetum cinerariifolium]
MIKVLPPKTAKEVVAREKERKARTTLLMALPKDHLAKFHKMANAKEMCEAIKSRFGGNDESKKMQKYLLKQQFEGTIASSSNTDNVAFVSTESTSSTNDVSTAYSVSSPSVSKSQKEGSSSYTEEVICSFFANQSSAPQLDYDDLEQINDDDMEEIDLKWQVAMISMRIKKFHKRTGRKLQFDTKDAVGTIASSSNTDNVAFVSTESTSSTNDVSTAYSVSSPSVSKSQKEGSSSYTEEVICSFFANQSSAPQLDYDDLEQINDDDMEEIDLKWQVAMISMRIKKFHKRTGRKLQFDTKDAVGFDKTKVECFNCHKMWHFARDYRAKGNQDSRRRDVGYNENKTRDNGRRPAYKDDSKALVTIDRDDIDWSRHVEEDAQNYAMMAYSSSNSDKLGDASVEITAYTLALKNVEAQLLCHQQIQLAYEQKIRFMKIDLDDKTDVLAYHKKLLAEALKEKENLKTKFENWHNSSKNLSRLLNTQMSANDKFRLGYGDYRYGSILSYENEVLQSVFMNKASDLEDTSVNDRYADRMHAVPPLMTGNYMPSGPDVEIDYSKFTYGPKHTSVNESDSKPSKYASCESDSSLETTTSMPDPIENPKVVCEHKVCTDAPIIEEYESDSDNDLVSNVQEDKETPSFAFTDYPHRALEDKGIVDSGYSRHMTENKAHLADYQEFKGGSVAFGGSNGRINGKGKIKAGRFSWVYFLKSKDETTPILMDFVRQAENQFNHKVKTIRSDNRTEFKNNELIEFCGLKGIKREYSNARTPQQNGVAERKNRTLIEAARTMLTDSFLPTIFWAEAVYTAFYVLIRFDGKSNSGFLVGYSLNIKAFRVYNLETKRVEENLYVNFLKNKPNVAGKRHAWMFNLDYLTNSMNYEPILVENQANKSVGPKEANNSVGTQANDDQSANSEEIDLHEEHFVLPIWSAYSTTIKSSRDRIEKNTDFKTCEKPISRVEQIFLEELEKLKRQKKEANNAAESLRKEDTHDIQNANISSTNLLNTASTPLSTAGPSRAFNDSELSYPDDPLMPHLEDIYASPSEGIFTNSSYDDEGMVTDFNNLEITMNVSPTPTTRIHTVHPKTQILGDPMSAVQTKSKKSWCDEFEELMKNRFQMSFMGELSCFLGLQVKQKEDGIFISQDKYVAEILKKFDFHSVKTASTLIETQKPLVKDEESADVDVTLKTSHLQAIKRIFRYLKGQSKLGLWYPKVSSFDLEAYLDSDYAGANLDRKSTTRGCQFLSGRLISWQCKKQTIMATSTTEVEYVAAAHCCGQVL